MKIAKRFLCVRADKNGWIDVIDTMAQNGDLPLAATFNDERDAEIHCAILNADYTLKLWGAAKKQRESRANAPAFVSIGSLRDLIAKGPVTRH